MGCHPSISGLFACSLIDLLFMWPLVRQPFRHVIKIMIFIGKKKKKKQAMTASYYQSLSLSFSLIASSFLLGLLPG
jgi:hypothetical protein